MILEVLHELSEKVFPKGFLWGELNREMCKCSLGSAKTKSVLSFLFQDLY